MKKNIPSQQTPANIAAVLSILTSTPQYLAHVNANLTAEQLQTPLGAGERSLTQDVAHLINCEERIAETIYMALLADAPFFPHIHPERDWGKLLCHDQFEFAELLPYFSFRRKVLLRVLNSLSDAQWRRVIREETKQRQESVYWRARTLAMHEQDHQQDIAAKLLNLGWFTTA